MKIKDILCALNKIAPFDSACKWDNCGLLCGAEEKEVSRVLVALDADRAALEFALKNGCELVISHHPVIFDAQKSLTDAHTAFHYIENRVAVISSHTCLDAASGGINDLLAAHVGITEPKVLMLDGCALGRYGDVNAENAELYIDTVKESLSSQRADYLLCRPIRRAAVVSGSGGSALELLVGCGCDTLITGEAKHEHFVYAADHGLNLLTFGHYETENIIVAPLASRLSDMLPCAEFIPFEKAELVKRR